MKRVDENPGLDTSPLTRQTLGVQMAQSASIVDYAEARADAARHLSDLAFGDAPAAACAAVCVQDAETVRAFRDAPRAHRLAA